jgi:non-heme Fe2+,alpha-ketoglutarate-dependent halogenase
MAGHPPLTGSARAAPLSAEAVAEYERDGYLLGLPVLDDASVRAVQTRFRELLAKLPAGTDINTVNCWHKANRWMYELSRFPPILDYVEGVLGSDFYCWGAQFFCKLPAQGEVASVDNRRQTVPWHQDGQYWPLEPLEAATAWLAVFDTDAGNAAMQVVAGSHRDGAFEHRRNERADYALEQEIPAERIDDDRVVSMDLRAGQMSLHDIGLVHGSTTSRDGRPRVGLTFRYSPAYVQADLSKWPFFEAYPVRGTKRSTNPIGKIPAADGVPTSKFQRSEEFA